MAQPAEGPSLPFPATIATDERASVFSLQLRLVFDLGCIEQAKNDVERGKTNLYWLGELREELSSKVKTMIEAKSQAETDLERIALQRGEMVLPYDTLMVELDVTNVRELEDFLINECMYAGIVRGKLDQLKKMF